MKSALPPGVECEWTTEAASTGILPEEAALVAGAVPFRRAEFAQVRKCARVCLTRLGFVPGPILTTPQREPIWPQGAVGSMTHCRGLYAASLGYAADYAAIGIDAEPNHALPRDVCGTVIQDSERAMLDQLARSRSRRWPEPAWDRLVFSAKESIFKAWFPLAKVWIDFDEFVVDIHPSTGSFTGVYAGDDEWAAARAFVEVAGRWAVTDTGHIVTAAAVPAFPPPQGSASTRTSVTVNAMSPGRAQR